MISDFKLLWVVLSLFVLLGCASSDKDDAVVFNKTETVVVAVPASMTVAVDIPAPAHLPATYSLLSCDGKEESNTRTISNLYKALKLANTKLEAIGFWTIEQKNIYKKE